MPRTFARNSLFATLASLGTALGSFMSTVLIARLLGRSETGTIAYVLWVVTLATTITDIGLTHTLTRYLPEMTAVGDDGPGAQVSGAQVSGSQVSALRFSAWLLRLGIGLVAVAAPLFCLVAWATGGGPNDLGGLWWLAALLFALQFVSALGLALLRGLQRFDTAAKLTFASLVLQLVAVGIGSFLHGTTGALAGYCVGCLPTIGVALRFALGPAGIDAALRARIVPFALYAWAGALTLSLVWSRAEIFFLQRYWGAEAVALFTVAFAFAALASQGPALLTGGLLPYFTQAYARGDTVQTRRAYTAATRVLAFVLFPTCFGLAVLLPTLLPLVYGAAFAPAVPAACVLVAGSGLVATGAVGSHLIYAHERSNFIFQSGLVGAALTVVAGLVVIPAYGIVGAALARTSIHFLMFAYGSWFIVRRLGCPFPTTALARLLCAALLGALAAHLCLMTVRQTGLAAPPSMILAIGSHVLVYLAAVRALGAMPESDVAWLRAQTGRLPRGVRAPTNLLLGLLVAQPGRA